MCQVVAVGGYGDASGIGDGQRIGADIAGRIKERIQSGSTVVGAALAAAPATNGTIVDDNVGSGAGQAETQIGSRVVVCERLCIYVDDDL